MTKPPIIFVSYAHEDKAYLDRLLRHLAPYVSLNVIDVWTDEKIIAGSKWDDTIRANLKASKMVMFLLSPDSNKSKYISEVEITMTTKMTEQNRSLPIIPILLRPVDIGASPLGKYEGLPKDNGNIIAISEWPNPDEAWLNVTARLEAPIKVLIEASQNGAGSIGLSNKVLMSFIYLLLAIGIGVLVWGFTEKEGGFLVNSGFTSIGIGLAGYFLERKMAPAQR